MVALPGPIGPGSAQHDIQHHTAKQLDDAFSSREGKASDTLDVAATTVCAIIGAVASGAYAFFGCDPCVNLASETRQSQAAYAPAISTSAPTAATMQRDASLTNDPPTPAQRAVKAAPDAPTHACMGALTAGSEPTGAPASAAAESAACERHNDEHDTTISEAPRAQSSEANPRAGGSENAADPLGHAWTQRDGGDDAAEARWHKAPRGGGEEPVAAARWRPEQEREERDQGGQHGEEPGARQDKEQRMRGGACNLQEYTSRAASPRRQPAIDARLAQIAMLPIAQRRAAVQTERARQAIEARLIEQACAADARRGAEPSPSGEGAYLSGAEESARGASTEGMCQRQGEIETTDHQTTDHQTTDELTANKTTTTDEAVPGARIIIYARVAGDG